MRFKIFADKPFLTIYEWNRYFYQGRVAFSSARLKTAAFPLGLFVTAIKIKKSENNANLH